MRQSETASPARRAEAPREAPLLRDETPMADRVATLGLLNKRNGIARDIILRPGQSVRVGDVIVRLRACETTDPSEPEQLTGAFVQADVRGRDDKWRRIFSGWLYKESPSLNVVENGLYDVWPKSCAMHHPDIGPDTVAVGAGGPPRRSSAKKSTGAAGRSADAERGIEQPDIGLARDLDRAERGEVIGDELAIEQAEPADAQPRDEPGERHLGGVAPAAEHALAEKGRAEADAVKPADEHIILPAFDRMGVAAPMEIGIGRFDLRVDPGIRPFGGRFGTAGDDGGERLVRGDGETIRPDRLGQRARQAELVERQHAALLRLHPENFGRGAAVRHREHADRIGAQQQIGIEHRHRGSSVWAPRGKSMRQIGGFLCPRHVSDRITPPLSRGRAFPG